MAFFWLPVGSARFDSALLEAFHLAKWYAREHVILCLVPAFFIAGAIATFISQGAVIRYLGAQAHKVVAYSVAWLVSVALLFRAGDEPNPLVTLSALAAVPIAAGLLLYRAPLLQRAGVRFGQALRRGLVAEVITWSLGLGVFFSVSLYIDNRWLSIVPAPTSPYYGALASLAALVGLIVLLVLHWFLRRRSFTVWAARPDDQQPGSAALRLPTLRTAWRILLTTLALMVAAIVVAGSMFGGG